jgi:hypothetical protein
MASGGALKAADDLDAVLVGPWVWPTWALRFRIPFFLVLAAAAALLPLTFSGVTWVFSAIVVGVIVAGLFVIFALAMEARSGTRLVGYSARGVFAPDLVPWDRVAGVTVGKTTGAGRAVTVERADGDPLEVAIPKTVTEPEYRAFAAALRTEAAARGIPA